MLDVGDGYALAWEVDGVPAALNAVPGTGTAPVTFFVAVLREPPDVLVELFAGPDRTSRRCRAGENAWALGAAWPTAELTVVDDAGHGATAAVAQALRRATDGYAG